MLKHVPMHLGAFERSPEQINWLSDSLPAKRQKEWSVLAPEDWFNKVWDTQLIWATPPAIAGAVVEQLCEAKQHTNPDHSHILIFPALMTASWRKQLSKLADVLVTVPVGSKVWPPEMHEPTIVIALICPLLTSSPWQVRDTKLVAEFAEGCGALIAQGSGLLCANFGQERGAGIPICKGAWHGKCYRQAENDAFPVLEAEDLDDSADGGGSGVGRSGAF
jgi:hypothetical protein